MYTQTRPLFVYTQKIPYVHSMPALPDSTGHPMDIRLKSILHPHVHGHEMDIHCMSDFGRLLMANFWTSIGYLDLDINREARYYCASIMFHASFVENIKYVYI